MDNNDKELRELIFNELRCENLKCGQAWVFAQKNEFVQNLIQKYKKIVEETIKNMVNEGYFYYNESVYDYTSNFILTEKCENTIFYL